MKEDVIRLLTFRISKEEILDFSRYHLELGLFCTLLIGAGRYWDKGWAPLHKRIGLESIFYILVLSFIIWLIFKPYRIERWKYSTVLTFVSLTSFPGVFFALPLDWFISIENVIILNGCFFAIIIIWRIGLLYYFLKIFTELPIKDILLCILLLITALYSMIINISVNTFIELIHALSYILNSFDKTVTVQQAEVILMQLKYCSALAFFPLLIIYFFRCKIGQKNQFTR